MPALRLNGPVESNTSRNNCQLPSQWEWRKTMSTQQCPRSSTCLGVQVHVSWTSSPSSSPVAHASKLLPRWPGRIMEAMSIQVKIEACLEGEHVFLQLFDYNDDCIPAQSALQEGLALNELENVFQKREKLAFICLYKHSINCRSPVNNHVRAVVKSSASSYCCIHLYRHRKSENEKLPWEICQKNLVKTNTLLPSSIAYRDD